MTVHIHIPLVTRASPSLQHGHTHNAFFHIIYNMGCTLCSYVCVVFNMYVNMYTYILSHIFSSYCSVPSIKFNLI